jgi:thiol-disulfide isomerase/thioredoxin
MRRLVTLAVVFIFSGLCLLNAQIDFVKVKNSSDMDTVWANAIKENLSVFVDVYASWCGPCKWLDANVFELEEAGEYMSKRFISVKLDGESPYGSLFARDNGLQAYPSLFVFNSEKKMMNMMVGAQPWEEMEVVLQNTVEFFPILELYQSKYDSEMLSREEYPAFVSALRKLKKDDMAVSVVGHYKEVFMEEGKLGKEDIGVIAYFVEPGSEDWKLLTKDIKKLAIALGEDMPGFVELAQEKSVMASVEESDFNIIQEFIDILPELVKGTDLDAEEIETRSHIYYHHYTYNFDDLMTYIDSMYSGPKLGDHEWLYQAAQDAVFLDARNLDMTKKGIEWFTKCIDEKETYDYYFHLALCQYFSELVDESLVSFEKAAEITMNEEEREKSLGIIEEIKAQE